MLTLPLYQVDAFAGEVFAGNPAAVCPLDAWLPDGTMQKIAAENNLSETAFFTPLGTDHYHLRWFTPTQEIDLCGHATLATAFVVMNFIAEGSLAVTFETLSGPLTVAREVDRYVLNFPTRPAAPVDLRGPVGEALGLLPQAVYKARDLMAVYESEDEVRMLQPQLDAVATFEVVGIVATAPGRECDFVSRFFCPRIGIAEDPVTGATHCTLVPYWSQRLQKKDLWARQLSPRGGQLHCTDLGDRVKIAGEAALYLRGEIFIPSHASLSPHSKLS